MAIKRKIIISLVVGFVIYFAGHSFSIVSAWQNNRQESDSSVDSISGVTYSEGTYLPLVLSAEKFISPDPIITPTPSPTPSASIEIPKVNVPYFDGEIRPSTSAVFWFGEVTPRDNYADVRVGYNDNDIFVRITAFDRRMWYDSTPAPADLTSWDSVTLYLNVDNDNKEGLDSNTYRFDAQINWWEEREDWQAGYRGNGVNWVADPVNFTVTSSIRGTAPNNEQDDRGWYLSFSIPFNSLGLSDSPASGSTWRIAIALHDRDDEIGTPIPDKIWPETMNAIRPNTWGQLSFGLPNYDIPDVDLSGFTTIRHKLDGANVADAHVGGHTICGQDYWPDFFDGWGDANYAGYEQINVQNQADVADWPCFSKYFVTFPLENIPQGVEIISATLTLHQFGNAGGSDWGEPIDTLIQVLTVAEDWDEATLTWNTSPIAMENVSQRWVSPLDEFPGWPGVPIEWDVSKAVAEAHRSGQPLRLALYTAAGGQHSGKYFVSSDTGDWNEEGRPTLRVYWGQD